MKKRESLFEEIKKFQGQKKFYFIILIMVGLIGLVFPVIPGLLLIGLGIALISPKYGDIFLNKVRKWLSSAS